MKSAALSLPSDSNMSSFPSISKVCRVLRRVSSFAKFLPILPSSLPPCLQLLASPKPLLLKWRMHCPNMSHWLLPVLLPLLEPDFQLKGCWNLTFSSNWENSLHPRFLQILNLHFYIFIFISGSDPILTADICLDVIFVFFIYNYLYLNLIFKINLHLYSQPGYERLCIGSWPPTSPWATLTEALLRCDRPTSSTVCTTTAHGHVEETTWLKSWHIMFSFVFPTIRSDHSQISICIIEQSLVNDSQACYQFEWQQRICFVGLLPWSTDNPCSLPL